MSLITYQAFCTVHSLSGAVIKSKQHPILWKEELNPWWRGGKRKRLLSLGYRIWWFMDLACDQWSWLASSCPARQVHFFYQKHWSGHIIVKKEILESLVGCKPMTTRGWLNHCATIAGLALHSSTNCHRGSVRQYFWLRIEHSWCDCKKWELVPKHSQKVIPNGESLMGAAISGTLPFSVNYFGGLSYSSLTFQTCLSQFQILFPSLIQNQSYFNSYKALMVLLLNALSETS